MSAALICSEFPSPPTAGTCSGRSCLIAPATKVPSLPPRRDIAQRLNLAQQIVLEFSVLRRNLLATGSPRKAHQSRNLPVETYRIPSIIGAAGVFSSPPHIQTRCFHYGIAARFTQHAPTAIKIADGQAVALRPLPENPPCQVHPIPRIA